MPEKRIEFTSQHGPASEPALPEYFRRPVISDMAPDDIVYVGPSYFWADDRFRIHIMTKSGYDIDAVNPASLNRPNSHMGRVGVMRVAQLTDARIDEGYVVDLRRVPPGSIRQHPGMQPVRESMDSMERADIELTRARAVDRDGLEVVRGAVLLDPVGDAQYVGDPTYQDHVRRLMCEFDAWAGAVGRVVMRSPGQ